MVFQLFPISVLRLSQFVLVCSRHIPEGKKGGRGEVFQHHGADCSRHLLLVMEAVALIAREDAVPIGPIHNMVIVLQAGLRGRPGNDGSRIRNVPNLDVHLDSETRIKVKSDMSSFKC